MEILILGLILVALMVYASTKIKRSAARAYEREAIEADEFSIVKPDGFINPVSDNSAFVFEANSKEFGHDSAESFRQARATLQVYEKAGFDEICKKAKESVAKIVRDTTEEEGGLKTCVLETEKETKSVNLETYYKITEKGGKTYELQITVLQEHKSEYLRRIEEMLESFIVK